MLKLFISAVALVGTTCAYGLQIVDSAEGQNAFVKMSAKELTRVVIEGGKIRTIFGTDGELIVEKNPEQGELYLRPAVLDKPINVRVISEAGKTYNLILQPVDIPQEDIVIREARPEEAKAVQVARIDHPAERTQIVREMVVGMLAGGASHKGDFRPLNQPVALWEGVDFVLTGTYFNGGLRGDRYRLTNRSDTVMQMVEQEFYVKGVIAVAIVQMTLAPGEATDVLVVRSN